MFTKVAQLANQFWDGAIIGGARSKRGISKDMPGGRITTHMQQQQSFFGQSANQISLMCHFSFGNTTGPSKSLKSAGGRREGVKSVSISDRYFLIS